MTNGASPAAFTVDGSLVTITGLVHSNANIYINGSAGSISPRIEYGTGLTATGNAISMPTGVKVPPIAPAHRDIAAYRPGGSAAVAAGAGYREITSCSGGKWTYSAAAVGSATVVHVPCSVVISSVSLTVRALVVAEGTILVSGALLTIGDATNRVATGLVSGFTSATAISFTGSSTQVYGSVQAMQGGVSVTGSYANFRCGILGDTVTLKGNAITVAYDSSCPG
jgi:hypothetical protein